MSLHVLKEYSYYCSVAELNACIQNVVVHLASGAREREKEGELERGASTATRWWYIMIVLSRM